MDTPEPATQPCRILVVDDEPRGLELLTRTLRSIGEVETALSGEEGWRIAQQDEFDLVISDQRMPGMSGVELLSRIAARDDVTGRILLTGYADLGATIEAINKSRIHAYLTKPSSPDEVHWTVRSVLDRVRLVRENASLVQDLGEKNRALEEALLSVRDAQQRVVAAERLAAIGRMSAMIVHDLRNPLAVIRSSGGELVRQSGDDKRDEFGELGQEILAEAERMQRMCTELLEIARASEGNANFAEHALDEVVTATLDQISRDASRAGVRIERDLQCEARLEMNEDSLRRALLNLARNAIEAMPEGGLLRVESRRQGEEVVLALVDSGRGVPEKIRDRIFEPFVSSGKPGGSGLGLAVVMKVVEDHGGTIEVSEPEGGGTAFHLRLPIQRGG